MDLNTFKMSLSSACAALLMTTFGHCDATPLETRVDRLETQVEKIRAENAYGNFGPRTAPAQPQIDGYGIFVTADFLWWKLYEAGAEFVFEDKNSRTTPPSQGKIEDFHFNWAPGFKIGAGYLLDYDNWDIALGFTYYQTRARLSLSSNNLLPLTGDPSLDLIQAKGHWKVSFYDLCAVVGRGFFVSKFLSFHPFFALATAWIQQRRHCQFTSNVNNQIALKSENDFWGIGPRLGVDTQFAFCPHWSLYANASCDLLFAHFDIREKQDNKTESLEIYNLNYNLNRTVPAMALGLGIAYETNLKADRYHLLIKAGYENRYFWRQNQLPTLDLDTPAFQRASEDLSLQGLTLDFRLDF